MRRRPNVLGVMFLYSAALWLAWLAGYLMGGRGLAIGLFLIVWLIPPIVIILAEVAAIWGGLLWRWLDRRRHLIDPAWRRFTRGDWQ